MGINAFGLSPFPRMSHHHQDDYLRHLVIPPEVWCLDGYVFGVQSYQTAEGVWMSRVTYMFRLGDSRIPTNKPLYLPLDQLGRGERGEVNPKSFIFASRGFTIWEFQRRILADEGKKTREVLIRILYGLHVLSCFNPELFFYVFLFMELNDSWSQTLTEQSRMCSFQRWLICFFHGWASENPLLWRWWTLCPEIHENQVVRAVKGLCLLYPGKYKARLHCWGSWRDII